MDAVTYALCKRYIEDSLIGVGALKGAPCKIVSITPQYRDPDYPTRVTANAIAFEWKDDDGGTHMSLLLVENGGSFNVKEIEQLKENTSYPNLITGYKMTIHDYSTRGAEDYTMTLNCGDSVRIAAITPQYVGGKVVSNIITFNSWSAEHGVQTVQLEVKNGTDGSVVDHVEQIRVTNTHVTYRYYMQDGSYYDMEIPIANALPNGGLRDQLLAKKTDANGDFKWINAPVSLPDGGNVNQILTKNSSANGDASWKDAPESVPAGGGQGAFLVKRTGSDFDMQWLPENQVMLKVNYDANNNGVVDLAEAAQSVINAGRKAVLKALSTDTTLLTALDLGVTAVPIDPATGLIDTDYLPDSIVSGLSFGGTFDAATRVATLTQVAKATNGATTDTITLTNDTAAPTGYVVNYPLFYICSNAGAFAGFDFVQGDWLLALQTQWYRIDQSGKVTSVNGKSGAVTLTSDDIVQGANNLYFTAAERNKLNGIEDNAQKNPDAYLVSAALNATQTELTLTDQSGTQIKFKGGDPDTYVEKNGGDISKTKLTYQTTGQRQAFTQLVAKTEQVDTLLSNVIQWLVSISAVGFSNNYLDLDNRPTKLSEFLNNGSGSGEVNDYFLTMLNALDTFYQKSETYTQDEINALINALQGMHAQVVSALPVTDIDKNTIYYLEQVDPQTGDITGYHMWQYISNAWVDLGSLDIDLTDYVRKDGDISTTKINTIAAVTGHAALVAGLTASDFAGAFNALLADLQNVVYTGKAEDLTYDNTASGLIATDTQGAIDEVVTELGKKVDIAQGSAHAGQVMMVNNDGDLEPTSITEGVVRRGTGGFSVIGGDTQEAPVNTATGLRSAAFGDHVTAGARGGMAVGRYNDPASAGGELFSVGGGTEDAVLTVFSVGADGVARSTKGVRVGVVTDVASMTATIANELTTKYYVDKTVAEATADKATYQVVDVVPEAADASDTIIYLLRGSGNFYAMWKKVITGGTPEAPVYGMVSLGTTEMSLDDYQLITDPTLATTNKTVPGAINELLSSIGDLAELDTTEKTNLVDAINELLQSGDVAYHIMTAGEAVRTYADGVKGAYILSCPSGTTGAPGATGSTVVSIPTADKSYYYQFGMAGNVNLYLRRQPAAHTEEIEWIQTSSEAFQYANLPTASESYADKVYQYIGQEKVDGGVAYKPGMWFRCNRVYYSCWLKNSDAKYYYTTSTQKYAPIYDSNFVKTTKMVQSFNGSTTMTDMDGGTYTKLREQDTSKWQWVPLYSKTGDFINNGTGTFDPNDRYISKMQLLDLIYPVGSIYITAGKNKPADDFGGTWQIVANGRVLWGVAEATNAGQNEDETLPNIKGQINFSGGSQGHPEFSCSGAFKNQGSGSLTWPQPSGASTSGRIGDFNASRSSNIYKDNAHVKPNAYTVHMWRRTA